ncbi:cellulose-binding domain-containing protein [Micromonospora sp. RL09-050-HVF-A]|uniref:cellulose-binding domain-containing protein n=1 Tax=Micromonospora sp. RL09-050-HVF-A TaxID=1703433 RepID=UPI0027E32648|nr:cellulose-binding domain-containing protein [Micromonospora sp. RL09-050-HVF-A]
MAATVTAAAAVTTVLAGTASAAQGCRVDYQPNEWTGGFTANVRVSPGDTALSSWTVTWSYPGGQRITGGWNAQVSQVGSTVTARNAAWNGSVPAGGSTEFGVQGTSTSGSAAPTGFALNGVPCNGAPPPTTTPPPTTPPRRRRRPPRRPDDPAADHASADDPAAHDAAADDAPAHDPAADHPAAGRVRRCGALRRIREPDRLDAGRRLERGQPGLLRGGPGGGGHDHHAQR